MLWLMVGLLVIVLYILVKVIGSVFWFYDDKLLLMIFITLLSSGISIYVLSALGAMKKRLKAIEERLDVAQHRR